MKSAGADEIVEHATTSVTAAAPESADVVLALDELAALHARATDGAVHGKVVVVPSAA